MPRDSTDRARTNDHTWDALIRVGIKYQGRVGKFRSVRYDRMAVYTVTNLRHLAMILVESGVIQPWPAGFRRLTTLEEGAAAEFLKVHKKVYTDP